MKGLFIVTAVLFLAGPWTANAATIVIVNNDGAGEGFNDPTPVSPVGGNPGTTIGQQRLNVFQEAANICGALLPSAVTIQVQAQFNSQSCDATSAVLGSAGPTQVFRDFTGAEVAGTWYHVALANKLAGVDLSGSNDIAATFNSSIDNNDNCLLNTNWYYGLDGNEGTDIELLPVVLHELGHGLGFSTLINLSLGSELQGRPDLYETFIRDNTVGLNWDQMSSGQRSTSATNTGNVVWSGAVATSAAPCFLGGSPTMFVHSPPALPSTIRIGSATFGAELTETGVTGDVILVDDGVSTTSDGCETLINGGAVSGNIALIDRGVCTFVTKAQNAQAAGAIAVIIANNVADTDPITLGGTDPSILIPVVSITLDDGNAIKAELGTGVNVTLKLDPASLAGTDGSGRVKLYAPSPLELGSSISHWDVSANPNLLMEPAINSNLSNNVDLTLAHFGDLGWLPDSVAAICGAPVLQVDPTVVNFSSVAFGDTVCSSICVINTGDAQLDITSVIGCDTDGFFLDQTGFNLNIAPGDTSKFLACFSPTPNGADSCQITINSDGGTGNVDVQVGSVTGVGDPGPAGLSFLLSPVFPTPFSAAAEVRFTLPETDHVRIDVFDIQGRRVRSLLTGEVRSAGTQSIRWDGNDGGGSAVSGGIYFVRVATESYGSRVVRAVRLN
jgi:hypothetical protein